MRLVDVIAVLLAVLILLAVITGARALPWFLTLRRRKVLVVLDSGQAIDGVLYRRRGALYDIRSAQIRAEGVVAPADGAVIVDRARVLWVQVLD